MTNLIVMKAKNLRSLFAFVLFNYGLKVVLTQTSFGDRCDSPDQYPGRCVDLEKCENLLKLRFKSPQTHRERLYVSLSQCGRDFRRPQVCCTQSPYPESFLSQFQESTSQRPATRFTTQRTPPSTTQFPFKPSFTTSTKHKNFDCGGIIDNRIFGGSETRIDEMPFTVLLAYSKSQGTFGLNRASGTGFFCGGALISSRSVLTAAHCVHEDVLDQKNWLLTGVRLGEWNLRTTRDCEYSQGRKPICAPPVIDQEIERSIVHKSFIPFSTNQENDIALLRMRHVEFNEFVKPICLPLPSNIIDNFDEATMIVAGFGKTETSDTSKIKLKTELRGISNRNCQNLYILEPQTIAPTQMCALGDNGKDSCNGDSGQPLIYVNSRASPPRLELVGIVSYGPSPCAQHNKPGVYTRIAPYLDWIKTNSD